MMSRPFMNNVLIEVGTPNNMRYITMKSILPVKICVLWNGKKGDYFETEKGLRQGDPISPYQIVLCMDKLFHLIMEQVDKGRWE